MYNFSKITNLDCLKNLEELKSEIVSLLNNNETDEELFSYANKVRKENVGDKVHLRGLIEFSNICRCNCKYCGLRAENKQLERYRILPEEIIKCAKKAVDLGYETVVLQSGEDLFYSKDILCEIISEIKKFNVVVTLSIGERSFEEYKAFKDAGADRYLIRIETTDKNLYKELHPKMSFENRVECIHNIKRLGYELGSGCLVGIPKQTTETLADDILFFKQIQADMIGIGPFISNPETPLGNLENGSFNLALKVMAITRILLPHINIPATTAMATLNPNGVKIALNSGANVVMPNVTLKEFRDKYKIYPNKNFIDGIEL